MKQKYLSTAQCYHSFFFHFTVQRFPHSKTSTSKHSKPSIILPSTTPPQTNMPRGAHLRAKPTPTPQPPTSESKALSTLAPVIKLVPATPQHLHKTTNTLLEVTYACGRTRTFILPPSESGCVDIRAVNLVEIPGEDVGGFGSLEEVPTTGNTH